MWYISWNFQLVGWCRLANQIVKLRNWLPGIWLNHLRVEERRSLSKKLFCCFWWSCSLVLWFGKSVLSLVLQMVPALVAKLDSFGFTHNSQEHNYRQIIVCIDVQIFFVFVLMLKLLYQITDFVVRLHLITVNIALKTRESYSRQLLNIEQIFIQHE